MVRISNEIIHIEITPSLQGMHTVIHGQFNDNRGETISEKQIISPRLPACHRLPAPSFAAIVCTSAFCFGSVLIPSSTVW